MKLCINCKHYKHFKEVEWFYCDKLKEFKYSVNVNECWEGVDAKLDLQLYKRQRDDRNDHKAK